MGKTNITGKDAYFFPHDINARNDPKILAMRSVYGSQGYAWYFMILEILREQPDYKLKLNDFTITILAGQCQTKTQKMSVFVEQCCTTYQLLTNSNNELYSDSLIRRMRKVDEKRELGRKAASIRWDKVNGRNADALPTHTEKDTTAMQTQYGRNTNQINTNTNTNTSNNGYADLIDKLQQIFGRLFNGNDYEKLKDLCAIYTKENIIQAAEIAVKDHGARSLDYVGRMLANGFTAKKKVSDGWD